MNTLLQRITTDLDARRDASDDNGIALADWLAATDIVPFSGTFEEAICELEKASDHDLQRIARALFCPPPGPRT